MPRTSGPFWAFFNTLPIGAIIFDLDRDDFVEINDAACAQLGYDRATLARMKVSDLDAQRTPESIRAERRQLSPSGPPRRIRTQLRRADRTLIHVDATLQCIVLNGRPLGYGVWTDVTELEAAVTALRERERDLARVQRIGRVGGYEIDLRTGFDSRRSPEYLRLHGLDSESVHEPHEAWVRRLHPEDRERTDRHFRETVASGAVHYEAEYRILLPDGQVRWLSSVAEIERDERGGATRMVGAHIDVTALRQAEHELAVHARRLEQADRRKNEFLAMLGHELRNPLAPILAVIERLRLFGERLDAADRAAAYAVIQRQAAHLRGLVDELLDIARITTGKIELTRGPLDLREVIEAAVEQVRHLIESRGHRLQVAMPAATVPIDGDSTRLIQVVVNLLDNAAKYTDPGGSIRIALERDDRDGAAVVIVQDSGRGIPADALPMIFDLFVQGHQDRPSAEGGLGVGLTLVQRLVALHGGRIAAKSDACGGGSRFEIRLPMLSSAAGLGGPAPQSGERRAGGTLAAFAGGGTARRILLVDDNVDAAQAMAELLRVVGHVVTVRHDGSELAAVVANERSQVVILDIGLPGQDGHALARELRRRPECGHPLLVALTGYGLDDDRLRSAQAGFDHHLVKPVDFRELLGLIEAGAPK